MRRRESQNLSDVIKELVKLQKLDVKINEKNLLNSWESVVGIAINKYCESKYIKNKVLYVKLSSSVLRNELMMSRQKLVENLNNYIGLEVIKDIRFY